ncbi:hypothetical protein CEXT_557661 [Caerostris extrusa]|uniref:Uncharacterized protein n=1 Tax=Caerostris extrusa TaxID=172846 RepID=A0AAV4UY47_CAEEX|nr:hypothetical protein CEXT_557661 [Caerostris extrusa]
MRTLKQLTIDNYFPRTSSTFRENFYMDDYYVERKFWRMEKSCSINLLQFCRKWEWSYICGVLTIQNFCQTRTKTTVSRIQMRPKLWKYLGYL